MTGWLCAWQKCARVCAFWNRSSRIFRKDRYWQESQVTMTKVPPGESYGAVEGPKGELGFYIVSNGTANPWRFHVRAPTFINLASLGEMAKGCKIADLVVILGAVDIVLGEVDR